MVPVVLLYVLAAAILVGSLVKVRLVDRNETLGSVMDFDPPDGPKTGA